MPLLVSPDNDASVGYNWNSAVKNAAVPPPISSVPLKPKRELCSDPAPEKDVE
jgi:hypothetical protein